MTPQSDFADAVRRSVVLMPTFNEVGNIASAVTRVLAAIDVDVCVIDDASPDGTANVVAGLVAADPRVHLLEGTGKQGLGPAYVGGFRWALARDYSHVVQMDADLSHPADRLPALLHLGQHYDLVLGSRWVPGGGTERWPRHRQWLSRWGSAYARAWLGQRICDFTGGFKCMRREVIEALDLDSLRSTGYAFQVEVTYRALLQGFTVTETPITFVERSVGDSKMSVRIVAEAAVRVPLLRLRPFNDRRQRNQAGGAL